jgi:uncharacterized protein (TIGR03083 family)
MSTTVAVTDDLPRLARPECTELATTEIGRIVELLRGLEDVDWVRPTDCPLWDVHALACHVLGMLQTFSSLRRFAGDMRAATATAKGGVLFIDALTDLQVRRNADLRRDELVEEIARLAPVQARWRARRRMMRRLPVTDPRPDGTVETWRLGYLLDIILTRDPWMHRIDLSRAVSRPLTLTPQHDGRVVGDVVVEWAQRHGQPFALTLTGPAGGRWRHGSGGQDLELDAVDFCRTVSGRSPGEGLLGVSVPF